MDFAYRSEAVKNDKKQPWFSDVGTSYRGEEPYYFDAKQLPWVRHIENNWTVIRDELAAFEAKESGRLVPYMDQTMVSRPNRWRTLGLMFWTKRSTVNCASFPQTCAILDQVPRCIAISFNLLEPNTTIKPHYGNTNAIYRCHLGLDVPAPAPQCGFRVGDQIRSWEEGKVLVFCDAYEHTAWNNTGRNRYVMVFDVMRPQFSAQTRYVSSRVLASIYLTTWCHKLAWLQRLCRSRRVEWAIFHGLIGFVRAALTLHHTPIVTQEG